MDKKKQPAKKKEVRPGAGISGSKQAEEALKESERLYRSLIECSSDAIFCVNEKGQYKFANQLFASTFGKSPDYFIGKTFWDIYPKEHADYRFETTKRVFQTGQSESIEVEVPLPDKTLFFYATANPIKDETGKVILALTHAVDITKRKQAETELRENQQKFQALVETTNDFIWEINLDGAYTYCSPQMEKLWGFKPEEMLGKTPFELLPPKEKEQAAKLFRSFLGTASSFTNLEIRSFNSSGQVRFLEISGVPFTDKSGKLRGYRGITRDITERKKAERAIQESEILYRTLVETSPDAIGLMDINGTIIAFNKQALEVFGFEPTEDLIGKNVMDLVAPENYKQVLENMAQLQKTAVIRNMELTSYKKDGQPFYLEISSSLLFDEKGKPKSVITIFKDVTERRRAGEALRESSERFSAAFSINPDPTAITVPETGQYIDVNPAYEKWSGFSREELLGKTSRELNMWVNPADRDTFLKRLRDNKAVEDMEITFRVRSGELRDTWFTARTALISGMEYLLTRAHDVTERNHMLEALHDSEEKYRLVVENAREAIFIAVDGTVKFTNRRIADLSGYSMEEITTRPFIEFIHPDDRRMVMERYTKWLNGEDVPTTDTVRFLFKPGNIIWGELNVVPITWEGRLATLGFLTDVTDRKRLEEEQQRVDKLESVGLLAGGIAHDFNNILTAILGNISLASAEAAPGSQQQESLQQAEKASQRAKALTVQLLTFSKGGAPVLKLASLTELLKDTARFALSGSKVKCHFSISPDLWHAEVDAGQVSQVIHNLVINAQQAMPGGGSIELLAENMSLSATQCLGWGLPVTAGNYIRIAVVDHGTGIPKEHLGKIFDPFFTTRQKGNGMGLAISFSIARQHGGHISVESEPGTGSTFYLYLPASIQISTPKEDKMEAAKPAVKARILVMDDEAGVREIAGRLLRHIGYQDVEFAEDGEEAIKLYKAAMKSGHPFNAAILDLTIAGGIGGEVTIKKLLKIDPGVKAIVSSGYIDDPVMANHRDHGFSGMVAKPYTLAELRKAVQDVIG